MTLRCPLFFLGGPTASGKTALAHHLADERGLRLLSVDSMMVYRGLDIGTAKPTPAEQLHYAYAGLNLANPGDPFSTGAWLRTIRAQLDERPTLAVGGTGLYFRALLQGLDDEDGLPGVDPALSVAELQSRIRDLDPSALDQLADPHNPRRLARALAWLLAGKPLPARWTHPPAFPLPVLRRPTDELNARIRLRAEDMFRAGLLDEARACQHALRGTSAQAIGYAEALALLAGTLSETQAIDAVATRTRQYAKRQRTWFRNQLTPHWIDLDDSSDAADTAARIAAVWDFSGPFWMDLA
jgi:tRNA dimethylallyltransferase